MNDQGYVIQIYPEGSKPENWIKAAKALIATWELEAHRSQKPPGMVAVKDIGSLWIKKDPMAKFVDECNFQRANAKDEPRR